MPPSTHTDQPSGKRQLPTILWVTAWLGLAATLAFLALSDDRSDLSSRTPVAADSVSLSASSAGQQPRSLRSIEDIRVGDRVQVDISQNQRRLARGRDGGRRWDAPEHAIDPEEWKHVRLTMQADAGDRFELSLLRPTAWFEASGAALGKRIQLSIPEQGLEGSALVREITPCPTIQAGAGRIVTGTFTHIRGGVLRIHVENVSTSLGVTGNYPVYSVTAGEFVEASALSGGDVAQLLDGPSRIERIEPVAGEHRVYNLEVRGDTSIMSPAPACWSTTPAPRRLEV